METSSRIINCNSDAALPNEKFCSNVIRTSKYTLLSFLPINLYEQFKRVTNLFFLGLGILQFFPIFQTIDPVVAILPLIIVLGGSMLKEGYEDSKRHRLDSQVNNRPIKMVQSKIKSVLIKSGNILSHNEAAPLFRQKPKITPMAADHCETIKWKDVQVGDVVIVYENEPFPADMVLIGTSDPEGICFVETKNLDGETNLKVHRAPDEFQGKLSVTELEKFSKFGAKIECGPPHAHLSSFSGVMTVEQCSLFPQAKIPLHIENILLRGCFLRNTNWIMGIVVFTGDETKIRLNSGATPLKRLFNLALLAICCIFVTIAAKDLVSRIASTQMPSWLEYTFSPTTDNYAFFVISNFCLSILAFQNLVPISLIISIEIIKSFQSYFIGEDIDLYYSKTDRRAMPKSANISDDLGQISHIFSDKTGTLTQNVMEFKSCSVGSGRAFDMPDLSEPLTDSSHVDNNALHQLFLSVALCHSVLVNSSGTELIYKSQSPDEAALINAAKKLDFVFAERKRNQITVLIQGKRLVYQVLNVLEFNSERKRMSVILRSPDNTIILLTKGADNTIFKLLADGQEESRKNLDDDLEEFASIGLRTLCYALKKIPEPQYLDWLTKYQEACISIHDREEAVASISAMMEVDLRLVGATAIEDKLQEGVPECIHRLLSAGIKIWVLTGDKTETAINIGYSCNLLPKNCTLLIIRGSESPENMTTTSEQVLNAVNVIECSKNKEVFSLVIDGNALLHVLREQSIQKNFLLLSKKCIAVICCRVSPKQKANVVAMVKKSEKAVTLAIGDGANDVSMIQEAHIGVGIDGEEGMQAAMAADYVISQFRFLTRLLLVEGRWCYIRTASMLTNFFYKNMIYHVPLVLFEFYSTFSGELVYEPTFMIFVQTIFSSVPVIMMGAFDQDIKADTALTVPQLYGVGIRQEALTWTIFMADSCEGLYHACIIYFFATAAHSQVGIFQGCQLDDRYISNVVIILYTMWISNISVFLNTQSWTALPICGLIFEFVTTVGYTFILSATPTSTAYQAAPFIFASGDFWLVFLLVLVTCLLPRLVVKYCLLLWKPTDTQIAKEIEPNRRGLREISLLGTYHSMVRLTSSRASLGYRSPLTIRTPAMTSVVSRSSTLEVTDIRFLRESFSLPRDTGSLILLDSILTPTASPQINRSATSAMSPFGRRYPEDY